MPREIISLHLGQAGCAMGTSVWDLITYESGINLQGELMKDAIMDERQVHRSTLFNEKSTGGYTPRALLIDTEDNVINDILMSKDYKSLFVDESCVTGTSDAANCFARGKFNSCKPIRAPSLNALRRQLEACSSANAMFFTHSCCGGTGSGYGAVLLQDIEEQLPNLTKHAHTLIPSLNLSPNVTEPYNVVLSLADTLELIDVRIIYDNETCYNLYEQIHKYQKIDTTYYHVNHLIAQVYSGITGCTRWDSQLDCDINQFQTNLVPFPDVNMISPSLVPLNYKGSKTSISTYGITADSLFSNNEMCPLDPKEGKYISCCMIYRGKMSVKSIHDAVKEIRPTFGMPFVSWVPTGFKIGLCHQGIVHPDRRNESFKIPEKSLLKLTNHTGMFDVTGDSLDKYDCLYKSRAFVFWFISEGMEEGEFSDAQEKLTNHRQKLRTTLTNSAEDGDDEDEMY